MNELTAAKGFPGYFEIPDFKKYAINENGCVIVKKTGKVLTGSVNPDGYHNFRLTDDYGKTLTWGLHRLLGYVFDHPGVDIRGLVVNHKDGVKRNNTLSNFEWTTYQGNAEHAGLNNLTTKCIPMSVRDVLTGEVKKYPSAVAYAKENGLSRDAVLWRLSVGEKRVWPDKRQYRKTHSDEPWYTPSIKDEQFGWSRKVALRELEDDYTYEFENLTAVSKRLGIALPRLSAWINNPDQPVIPGFIQLQWVDEQVDWREVKYPQLELDKTVNRRSVVVVDEASGERTIFSAAVDCAKAIGIKVTTLHHRLQSRGRKIIDGKRFAYYADTV